MKINLIKQQGVLMPATQADIDKLANIKSGQAVEVDVKQKRNVKFHRKFFAMLNIGFDSFEPDLIHNGQKVQKNFERFRKDVIISAGFYDVTANIKGEVRAEAKSISFGSMSEDEFNELYNACCRVLLQRVLHNYTRDDLDSVVDQLVRF